MEFFFLIVLFFSFNVILGNECALIDYSKGNFISFSIVQNASLWNFRWTDLNGQASQKLINKGHDYLSQAYFTLYWAGVQGDNKRRRGVFVSFIVPNFNDSITELPIITKKFTFKENWTRISQPSLSYSNFKSSVAADDFHAYTKLGHKGIYQTKTCQIWGSKEIDDNCEKLCSYRNNRTCVYDEYRDITFTVSKMDENDEWETPRFSYACNIFQEKKVSLYNEDHTSKVRIWYDPNLEQGGHYEWNMTDKKCYDVEGFDFQIVVPEWSDNKDKKCRELIIPVLGSLGSLSDLEPSKVWDNLIYEIGVGVAIFILFVVCLVLGYMFFSGRRESIGTTYKAKEGNIWMAHHVKINDSKTNRSIKTAQAKATSTAVIDPTQLATEFTQSSATNSQHRILSPIPKTLSLTSDINKTAKLAKLNKPKTAQKTISKINTISKNKPTSNKKGLANKTINADDISTFKAESFHTISKFEKSANKSASIDKSQIQENEFNHKTPSRVDLTLSKANSLNLTVDETQREE